jgi:hypothetical protein
MAMKKKQVFLSSYFDFDATFPMEYFEIGLIQTADDYWLIYYATDDNEFSFGPYSESELLNRITLAPFLFEEMVFIYHLIENSDPELHDLGVRLLRKLI